MGFFSGLKSVLQTVTGHTATIRLQAPTQAKLGKEITVTITVKVKGQDLEMDQLSLILQAIERVDHHANQGHGEVHESYGEPDQHETVTYKHPVIVAESAHLPAHTEHNWSTTLTLPQAAQPTYTGQQTSHTWQLHAELETFGGNPKSKPHILNISANS
ncbi:hypothetical protein [Magnetococcus sp. PR-3]|uniref:hypothetical protein n=1 Tax=Magnetococcus sp. PR-3 TaxID=3120355 RepID=UPI002FCE1DC7